MPLQKVQFRPGIVRTSTTYSNEGGWYDGDRVRFRFGYPESIKGWARFGHTSFLGTCRAMHSWVALDGAQYIGVGTHLKYYINEGGAYYDITPVRATTAAGDVTFAAADDVLAAALTASEDTLTLASASGFPETGLILINSEQIRYAAVSGSNLIGLQRGQNGTTAADHSSADVVTCATLTVSDTGHGALEGDFVTFSGATGLGGNMTADVLNQEYQVTAYIDSDTYLVEAREVAAIADITTDGELNPTYVFSTSSDTGSGGASTVGAYQLNTGLDTSIVGTGWGAGGWGGGGWGAASTVTTTGEALRVWSHDNYGEDLLFNVRDGGIYYWDKTGGLSARAVALSSLSGSSSAPTIAKQVLVSDRDRHIIAFGCDPESDIGTQDPLVIRFSSQESLTSWASLSTNTAGELRLGAGSEIITAVETRQQILVLTDVAAYAMQYIGAPFTFGISLISANITVQGPLAAINVDDNVFWMGARDFYTYTGSVNRLPCPVRDYVFDNFNHDQAYKTTAALNSEHSEVWWFYPSGGSSEVDRYVAYNYVESLWHFGTLNRTCWLDRGIEDYPLAASTDGYLYNHEYGGNDGSTTPASALNSYIASSPMDLGDGEDFTFISRMIPEVDFRASVSGAPQVEITTAVRNKSNGAFSDSTESAITESTELVHLRLRGRQFTVRVDCTSEDTSWRLGDLRYDTQSDGRR